MDAGSCLQIPGTNRNLKNNQNLLICYQRKPFADVMGLLEKERENKHTGPLRLTIISIDLAFPFLSIQGLTLTQVSSYCKRVVRS